MQVKAVAAVAIACALLAAPVAHSAPVPCKVVTDVTGDATQAPGLGEGSTPNEPALDIVSMDLGSDAKQMTTVMRVDKLAKYSATSPQGFAWITYFRTPATELFTHAQSDRLGRDRFYFGWRGSNGNRVAKVASGVIDEAKSEVRVTFNLNELSWPGTVKPGTRLSGLSGVTARMAGVFVLAADEADGQEKPFPAGRRTCVAVGK